MSNLTPEKRLDRNGKLVTRHVRNSTAKSASQSIPAPTTTSTSSTPPGPSAARTKPRTWDVDRWSLSRADSKLRDACTTYNTSYTYDFTCSDVEAYDVMSVVNFANAVPVLSTGARSAAEAVEFLKKNNLQHLIIDNAAPAREALARNLSAERVAKGYNKDLPADAEESEHFMDAVEASTMASLDNGSGWHSAMIRLTLKGRININDVKTIGVTRVAALALSETERLEALKRGDLGFNAETYRELVIRTNKHNSSDQYTTTAVLSLARQHGADNILKLEYLPAAAQINNRLDALGYPEDQRLGAITWHDEFRREYMFGVSTHDIMAFYESGISPHDAALGLQDDLTAQQIIGIHNGIESSVAEGWL